MNYILRLTQFQSLELNEFLFKDKYESAMLGLCGFDVIDDETLILVHRLIPVPNEICERKSDYISWPTEFSESYLTEAIENNLTIVKFHSHPAAYKQFSFTDDNSDSKVFDYFNAYFDDQRPVASVVMTSDKTIFGRVILSNGEFIALSKISVIGEQQRFYFSNSLNSKLPDYSIRTQQTFGEKTTRLLNSLKIGVVGCSGIGSATIFELARSGIGELVLVDKEKIAIENINRIFGASVNDVGKYKVDFFKEKIEEYCLKVKVTAIIADINKSSKDLKQLSICDHIFGCTDAYLPRNTINRLSTYYIVGYTDLAVGLNSDGKGGIDSIIGWVRYLIPGGSSLVTRKMYDSRDLESEALILDNPKEYERRLKEKYIKGANEKSPPVISLNTTVASLGITDYLDRLHPFKYRSTLGFCIDFCENKIEEEPIYNDCPALKPFVGIGKTYPFLNLIGIDL